MTEALSIHVDGLPPAKQISPLLAPNHPHRARVIALLEATRAALPDNFEPYTGAVALTLMLFAPQALPPGDPTNFLGGVADVLQRKPPVYGLETLGDVMVYENDVQLRRIEFHQVAADRTHYELRIQVLDFTPLNVPRIPAHRARRSEATEPVDFDALGRVNDLALAFANALIPRYRAEPLQDYESLVAWFRGQGTVAPGVAHALASVARRSPAEADRCFNRAAALAATIRAWVADPSTEATHDEFTRLAMTCAAVRAVHVSDGGEVSLISRPNSTALDSILCPILDSLVALSAPAMRSRLRMCRDNRCAALFLDKTKNASRTWCSMDRCGSRAKVRTFRIRHRGLSEGALGYRFT